ncbi:unnamed protein product [Phytomonas sp. Hart1]|nr:unnamed protein product [Phytomonas sp. Hart1]|eukprot:CCW72245.1 unnamed protein product [Phytomonas sp. isolate Hart1]
MLRSSKSVRGSIFLRITRLLRKRSGKPNELPEYKQVYLPYDATPTQIELDRERKKFSRAYHGRQEHKKLVEIKNVPQNMFTYGKEGMSIPISIFKDQQDPVIGPEWTYPGIYENKIVAQHWYLSELFDREEKGSFESPWQKQILDNQVKRHLGKVAWRMRMLKIKTIDIFHKERGSSKRPGAASGTDGKMASVGNKRKK